VVIPPLPEQGLAVLDDDIVRRLLDLRASVARPGENMLGELLRLFATDSASRIAALRAAVAADDEEAIRMTAHALKGAAANMGALRVVGLAQRLERDQPARTLDAVDALERFVLEATDALRARFT
jgi:HPt (histidine-containing phosphotransfer) domain-containing protein